LRFLRVLDGQLDRALGAGDADDADRQALAHEHVHQLTEPLALDAADQVLGRHARVVEKDLASVEAVLADLLEHLVDLEAGRLGRSRP
jgi:uncharacterized SAM-dependent methyltransferase